MTRNILCCAIFLLICGALVPCVSGIDEFDVGSSATADKPQSKLWYHDGSWWCILYDGKQGGYFYKLAGDKWEKGTFPDALVYPGPYTRADVLSKGDTLFVLEWEESQPRLYKYVYDSGERIYQLLNGFPVNLSVPKGHETMVIAQDSRGKLWVAFALDTKVKAIYSTSDDHLVWNTEGVEVGDGLYADDIASVIAFDGKIGVFWSNQKAQALYFRIRRDDARENEWLETETVASGELIADDHINMALSDDGRIFAVTKTSVDDAKGPIKGPTKAQFILNVRSQEGVWKFYDVEEASSRFKSRPIVVLDDENDDVYVFYRDDRAIVYKRSPMSDISFAGPPVKAIAAEDMTIRNVTSTKQNVTSRTGIVVMGTGNDNKAYSGLVNIVDSQE